MKRLLVLWLGVLWEKFTTWHFLKLILTFTLTHTTIKHSTSYVMNLLYDDLIDNHLCAGVK